MESLKNKLFFQLAIIYTRYLVGGAFVFASIIKIKGERFTGNSGAENPINSAWHFFETVYQSGFYWHFIGFGQLVVGMPLLTHRFRKLGALVYFPIILNITVITYSYDFNYTPVITTAMLLANVLLLIWDVGTFKVLFNLKASENPFSEILEDHPIWEITGLLIFIFTFLYRVMYNSYNITFWLAICLSIGLAGLLIGILGRKKINYITRLNYSHKTQNS